MSNRNLDYRRVAPYWPPVYNLAMAQSSFKDRLIAAMKAAGMNKAQLSRASGVPYHAIDKLLKRPGASTSADNAKALADAVGIKVDDDSSYDELRRLYLSLSEQERAFLLKSARGLAALKTDSDTP